MSLGTTISRLRAKQHLSQGELADALGVSRQSVSKWETDSSVPELDKLVGLSRLFGVTLDALVLETAPAPEDAPESAPSAPPPKPDPGFCRGQAAGTILLCTGFLVVLVLAQEGLFTGLLLASPFLLCGAVCLLFQRRAGLWCGWIVFLLADLYFRLAAGINWRLTLHTLSFTPEQNDWRLATAWVQLLWMLSMIVLTVYSFRKARIVLSRRGRVYLSAGWLLLLALCVLPIFHVLFAPFMLFQLSQPLADDLRLALFTALLVLTVQSRRQTSGRPRPVSRSFA